MASTKQRNGSRNRPMAFEVRVPGSTSNLGAGFDCFGLALNIYLTIRATIRPSVKAKCRVRTTGSRDSAALPRNETNLIYRAMSFTAFRLGVELPPIDLAVHNDIPLASGLGSSAAAIVGAIKLCGLISNQTLDDKTILTYAAGFEGHPDNVSAALQGGLAVNSVDSSGEVLSVKINWPSNIKVVVVSPKSQLPTHVARAALARTVTRGDAVYNLQRSAMLVGAISEQRYDLLWEAMKDRLHQPRREALVPGLAEALSIKQTTGLLGVALSGAGPSIVALATDREEEIAARLVSCFRKHEIRSTVRVLEVDAKGCQVRRSG